MINIATSTSSMIQGLYVSSSISLSTFLYLTNASKPIKAPVATRTMPKIVEYPRDGCVKLRIICFINNIWQSFDKQGKLLDDEPECHYADTGPYPGKKGPLIRHMIAAVRSFC